MRPLPAPCPSTPRKPTRAEGDVLPALGAGDHRTDCDHQDVDELMIAPGCLARILQPRKARCQALDHAARPRLHPTGNGQHIRQSTARPKLMLMLMREPWVHRRAEPAMVWPRKAETGACQMASALLSVARRPSPSLFYLQRHSVKPRSLKTRSSGNDPSNLHPIWGMLPTPQPWLSNLGIW
jgi:hypothetical protein